MSEFVRIDGIDEFFQALSKEMESIPEAIVNNLSFIGESAVKYARLNHTNNWTDQTGNLRSSIGYVILKDGRPLIATKTEQVPGPKGDGSEGVASVQPVLDTVASRYPKGYVLIVCAGMNYATYVEEIHGRDVLTGAKEKARELANQLFR